LLDFSNFFAPSTSPAMAKRQATLSNGRRELKGTVDKKKRTTRAPVVKRSIAKASSFNMGRVMQFGKLTRPKKIVVMFHGMADNAAGCSRGWADYWAARLPGALVVVPEAGERTLWDEGKNWSDNRIGRDWHRQHGSHDVKDKAANVAKIQKVARWRMRQVNTWLGSLLRKHGLANKDLILTGFSQGTNVALLAGANRGVKSVLLCGGPGTECVFSEAHKSEGLLGQADLAAVGVLAAQDSSEDQVLACEWDGRLLAAALPGGANAKEV